MFGYVFPYKPELKIKEYNVFKAYYCGLCKSIGKNFNQIARFGLNYDLTFLALLLSSLDKTEDKVLKEGCIANPLNKKFVIKSNINIDYCAYMNIMLVYFKILDDLKDEKDIKALFALPLFVMSSKRACIAYKDKCEMIKSNLEKLSQLEKNKCNVIDEAADTFAKIMEQLFVVQNINSLKEKRVLSWFGYNLGRYIYILDAFNDIETDIKKNNYNPILLQYQYIENELVDEFINRVIGDIRYTLTFTLDNIAKSFELLDVKKNRGLIENIVYMGLRHKMNSVFLKGGKQIEKSISSVRN